MDSLSDWDQPISQEELEAIEAVFDSVTTTSSSSSLIKRSRPSSCNDDDEEIKSNGRRLPNWGTHQCSSICSSSLLNPDSTNSLIGGNPNSFTGSSSNSTNSISNTPCYSHQVNRKLRYPVMAFAGRIIYGRTPAEVEKASIEILDIIETKKESTDQVTLGFDIEWKPTFKKGSTVRKVAVMQICGGTDCCYVLHIHHSGIPLILKSLLEDPTSVKVGVAIGGDAMKLYRDYNVCVKALEDLSELANKKLGGPPRMWSLRKLAETFLQKQIEKTSDTRLGNWEADFLSKKQLHYAALDAFASWRLCQVLRSFPDLEKNQTVTEVNGVPISF